ncbi:MAG: CDP-abequose synthase [Luteibacter sp.]|uniref:NAD-dependent epimerase/dehydratase family protein n=1 Tax=Luteibacter sp. TaxID=1886636 RepID=UPI00137D2881|nr:NAD(P)-dependent oxidoreductase [Luteibacter sp.]KAF1008012.1 MAG: CDP-abequose synthase [Luteibacter sp.]
MRVLLTGGAGFIGSRLIAHLQAARIDVVSIGRSPLRSSGEIRHVLVPGGLDGSSARKALEGEAFDAILHLAAAGVHPLDRSPEVLIQVNGFLPSELVSLAHDLGCRAFLMTGTNSEYASFDGNRLDEATPLETRKLYGATKAAGAMLAVAKGAALGVSSTNLRLFNVYGPGEAPHRLLPSLRNALLEKQTAPLSEGHQLRDFVHIDDACRAILGALAAALDGTLPGGHYNVCSGIATSVRDFALHVAQAMRADTALLQFGAIPLRPDDQPRVIGNPDALASHISWHPRFTVTEGIQATIAELSQTDLLGTP